MDRKEFLKSFCFMGVCSCAAVPIFAANWDTEESDNKKIKELNQKIQFMQKRFGKLIKILDEKMDDSTLNKVLGNLGRECSKDYEKYFIGFKNNLKGFLEMVQKSWGIRVEHEKKKKVIKLYGKKTEKCLCAFVKKSLTPTDFCNCSLGWWKHTFGTVIGKPVKVKIIESVLRGGKSCSFSINYS